MEHHEDTLGAYVRRVKADPNAIAVIVVGSVARGTERPDSDVDVYLVVPDDVFDSAIATNRVIFVESSDAKYPGGYVDVKLATVAFLDAAAERGDDPVRASFEDAGLPGSATVTTSLGGSPRSPCFHRRSGKAELYRSSPRFGCTEPTFCETLSRWTTRSYCITPLYTQ